MSRAKPLMIQGTMSNAGKSFLTAALCRVFLQDGFRVAPFKSQNMALNSYVTAEGLEMGRAQVVQAQAAGVEPSVHMNPVLLKPTGNAVSQVIVRGEILRDMHAEAYYHYKKELKPLIQESYEVLASLYERIVIEGAGSPAEINLKENDIVNMGIAEMAAAPVLLVADIDRGGVFAQIYGTWALLTEEERAYLKGFVINKFRGDENLLTSGIRRMEEMTGMPCLGVLPMAEIDLEDEDSLAARLQSEETVPGALDIAVIRLPWISNFTDVHVFTALPGVHVRFVKTPSMLGTPDMVLLPGSKNTIADLKWLKESGMAERIAFAKEGGSVIFGICGGYQMLGETVEECLSDGTKVREEGLGYLPVQTVMRPEKKRTLVRGVIAEPGGTLSALSGREVTGYEIHMGETDVSGEAFVRITDAVTGEVYTDGCGKENVYGTYLHGVFDKEGIAEALCRALAKRKGRTLRVEGAVSLHDYREIQYDKAAALVREHLDMELLERIIAEGAG